jgi:putative copper export protein
MGLFYVVRLKYSPTTTIMETWEQILLGVLAVVLLLFFGPGVNRMIRDSPKGSAEDWKGALLPLLLVVGFVVLLIFMVAGCQGLDFSLTSGTG